MEGLRWPRDQRGAWLALASYLALFVASPLAHHDLACHVKSPTHCDACQWKPLAPTAEPGLGPERWTDRDVRKVEAEERIAPRSASLAPVPGRSPPA